MAWEPKSKGLYLRLPCTAFDDPRMIEAGALGQLLYIRCRAASMTMKADGRVHRTQLRRWAGEITDICSDVQGLAATLVEVGLWTTTDDGWTIPLEDWSEWNKTSGQMKAEEDAEREQAAERQRAKRERDRADQRHANVTRDKNPVTVQKEEKEKTEEKTETETETETEEPPTAVDTQRPLKLSTVGGGGGNDDDDQESPTVMAASLLLAALQLTTNGAAVTKPDAWTRKALLRFQAEHKDRALSLVGLEPERCPASVLHFMGLIDLQGIERLTDPSLGGYARTLVERADRLSPIDATFVEALCSLQASAPSRSDNDDARSGTSHGNASALVGESLESFNDGLFGYSPAFQQAAMRAFTAKSPRPKTLRVVL